MGIVLLLPAAGLPFLHDDLNSVLQAAITLKNPEQFGEAWMGGLLRPLPKLHAMAVLAIWGPESWVFRIFNLLLHSVSIVLAARVFQTLSGSRRVGLWTGALFALGLGYYGRAVLQVSNVTMVGALTLFLAALSFWLDSRRLLAAVSFTLSALCHEVVWAAPLLMFFLPETPRPLSRNGPLARRIQIGPATSGRLLAFVCVALWFFGFLPGWVGDVSTIEAQYLVFVLFPFNPHTGGQESGAGRSALVGAVESVAALRPWLAQGALIVCAWLALRTRGVTPIALSWVLVFFVPFSAAMATFPQFWAEQWLDRRYLYFPALGLCYLVGSFASGASTAARRAVIVSLIAWCVVLNTLTMWKSRQDAARLDQRQARNSFFEEIGQLDPRWRRDPGD